MAYKTSEKIKNLEWAVRYSQFPTARWLMRGFSMGELPELLTNADEAIRSLARRRIRDLQAESIPGMPVKAPPKKPKYTPIWWRKWPGSGVGKFVKGRANKTLRLAIKREMRGLHKRKAWIKWQSEASWKAW